MARVDFDKIFKLQMIVMRFCLSHPDMKHDLSWALKIIMLFSYHTLVVSFLFNSMIIEFKRKDYWNTFRQAVPVQIYICVIFNYVVVLKKRKTIAKVLNLMKADYKEIPRMDQRSVDVILKYAEKSTWIMKRFMLLMVLSVCIFILKSIFVSVYHVYQGDYEFVPYHDMVFFEYVDKRKKDNVYIFAMTYLSTLIFSMINALIYSATTPLGPIYMLHACGRIQLIINKFDKIIEKEDVDERLKDIVKDLQSVYEFVADINECFTFIYEVMLKQTSIALPVVCYTIVKAYKRGENQVEYLALVVGAVLMTTPCYYSDMLMSKGEELREAAYACGWERVFLPKARKTLLIILARATQPITIRSVFHIINLDTLANVYRQAYTFFNLMTAMWD